MNNLYLTWSAAACMFAFGLCMFLVALRLWPACLIPLATLAGLFFALAIFLLSLNQRWRKHH